MSRRAKEILKKECISRTEGGGAVIADVHLCGLRESKEWYHEKANRSAYFPKYAERFLRSPSLGI